MSRKDIAKDGKKTQFKKGISGNIKGKPVGTLNRSTIARRWLEVTQTIKNPLTGKNEKLAQQDIMTLAIIKKARDGDVSAYRELMDSAFGKAIQSTDLTTGGQPIKQSTSIIFIDGDSDK